MRTSSMKVGARKTSHRGPGAISEADRLVLCGNYARLAAHVQTLLPAFFDAVGDLPRDRRDLMAAVCERIPTLLSDRAARGYPITRVHGDPHFWNVFFPKDPARHGCVFVDWEDWRP